MRADTEDKVVTLLQYHGLWGDNDMWRYYGDRETNYNAIGNQMSSADAALIEKLVNSVDARLTNACLEAEIDPTSKEAPKNIRGAVAKFFDDNPNSNTAGLISNWLDKKRREEALNITFASTGSKPRQGKMSISIADCGEGQTPNDFPTTFLSLDRSNKLRIPFVQGKFNMGGTGVLKFGSPKYNLQMILSKRNPKILEKAHSASDNLWGFTIVRREEPPEMVKNTIYTYLAPIGKEKRPRKGDVLRFSADHMPIFPEGQNAYARSSEWGTLIKLYEYDIRNASNILLSDGLLHNVDLLMPETALPIRFYECRSYGGREGGSYETNMNGLRVRLEDDRANNLEFKDSSQIVVDGEKMDLTIYAFKKGKAKAYHTNEGILFTVNGQTHGHLDSRFFSRNKVGLDYIKDSILVIVDCSQLSRRDREDLFMNSRDRLANCTFKTHIEENLENLLRNHQGLRDLRERRRREEAQEKLTDSKPLKDTLKNLLEHSPTLEKLFLMGQELPNPFRPDNIKKPEREFDGGKMYPTYFRFRNKESGYILDKKCPNNRKCRIEFETDAENSYFERDKDRGEFSLFYTNNSKKCDFEDYSINLHNGIALLYFSLPHNSSIGDTIEITSIVKDKVNFNGFVNEINLKIIEPYSPPPPPPPNPSKLELPEIRKVKENTEGFKLWHEMSPPFNKFSGLRIKQARSSIDAGGRFIYDFYVNVDNFYLMHEIKNSKADADLIEAKFIFSLVLLTMGLIHQHIEKQQNEDDQYDFEYVVEEFSKGVAPIILPMLENLGKLEIGDIESI